MLAAVAAATFAAAGCGVPVNDGPRPLDPESLPPTLREPTASATATATAGVETTPAIYFVRGTTLVALCRNVAATSVTSRLDKVMSALSTGPARADRDKGIGSAIPAGMTVRVTELRYTQAVVELSDDVPGPAADRGSLAVAQVVLSATSVPGVTSVVLTRDGRTIEAPRADGSLAPGPLTQEDYRSLLSTPSPDPLTRCTGR